MNTTSYIMKVTALNPISHIGKTASTGSIFNTEKVDGQDVPYITGTAMKGLLRRIGMEVMLSAIGLDSENYDTDVITDKPSVMTQNRIETLFNGSILSKSGRGIDISQGAYLSELIPWFAIVGGCLGNMMMQGRIAVNPMILVCKENYNRLNLVEQSINYRLSGDDKIKLIADDDKMESYRYFLQRLENTHLDDFNRLGSPAMRYLPKNERTALIETKSMDFMERQAVDYQDESSHVQMRYSNQVITANSKFIWQVDTFDLTPLMESAFHLTMSHFLSRPYIGGKRTYGFGHVHIEPLGRSRVAPVKSAFSSELGFKAGDDRGNLYYRHLINRKDEIIKAIETIAEK